MGVVVSKKDGQDKTKKVQQTAAVVKAFKSTPNTTRKNDSKPSGGSYDWSYLNSGSSRFTYEGRNADKSSLSYGLPELKGTETDTSASSRIAGNTGYWDGSDTNEIPYFGAWKNRVEDEELCCICGVYAGGPVHPCRVCCKVYHERCIRRTGRLNDAWELELFRKANSEIGWSCHNCESLTALLTEEEMQDLIENFDRLDVNQDTQITKDEYVRYKKAQYKDIHKSDMPRAQVEEAQNEFVQMDKNRTGDIDWWEFLNHEALKTLGIKRSKFQLVRMLSPREIQSLRDIFHAFDKDEDGYINSYEVSRGFGRWFGNLRISSGNNNGGQKSSFGRALDPKTVSQHVDRHTEIFMHADTDNNRLVSWDEYLREQALFALADRPNYRTS
ncbi:PHD finger protein 24 [Nematostella vectensis]|uniref:PHD finger protein 24 n=1 Tax=Nematostella vectensis TaxID=45351 RepID=UPI002076F53D|nr:PHD finger protein 24 [Nematostella vectensis]